MTQYIVWTALIKGKEEESGINKYFKEKGWGKVKYKFEFKTLPGRGGEGGRTDTVFLWKGKGNEVGKFSVGRFQMGGISWLGDYVNNNRDIIPSKILNRLRIMIKKTGDYEEREDENEK